MVNNVLNNAPTMTNSLRGISPTLNSALGGGSLFSNSANALTNSMNAATTGANAATGAANAASKGAGFMGKLGKGLDMANQFVAPIQAVGGVIGLGFDIANTVEANKRAKEQLDLSKKNFNLELEKMQKNELANNKLAASIDKAWGGDGKIENTIDYSQYKTDSGGGNSLQAGGAGGGYVAEPSLSGSGATPMASGSALTPVGYSESLNNESQETEETPEQ